jgi:DNA integrity scanning protein DisA with diadenylate cyclase activity
MAKKTTKTKKVVKPIKAVKAVPSMSRVMLEAAQEIIKKSKLQALLLYVDGLDDIAELEALDFSNPLQVVLVARDPKICAKAREFTKKVVVVPAVNLTRMGQIKMAMMLSFSRRFIQPGDRFVFLTGLAKGKLDTLMVMEVGREYEMFQSVDQPPLTEHIRRAVFERVLNLALELAAEGREGKPVGAIFVLGDSKNVTANARQIIMNPFKGYPEEECNILDDSMTETIKEFSSIDGAFVIKGTGTILSAGTYLLPKVMSEELPQGLGARHAAAAAVTAVTRSIALTISESTGTVRIWRQGQLITEIEKAKRSDVADLHSVE